MKHTNWTPVTYADHIPVREGRAVTLGSEEIAVFNLGTKFLAVQNRCPHTGGPLADGIVSGATVVCPLHAWKVCLESGSVKRPESTACLTTYPVRVEDGIVQIALNVTEEIAA